MKPLKTFGLATVAALTLIVLIAAGSASATVLCSNNSSTSSCNETYGAGTEIHAVSSGTSKLTTSFKNIECSESTIAGKVESGGGSSSTVSGNVSTLTFGGCNCTVTVLKKGSLEIHAISGTDNGTLTSSGAEVTASCSTIFGTVHCIYATSSTDLGTLTGGNPANVDVSSANIPRLTTSALCDESANWDATYEITSPKALYVAVQAGPVPVWEKNKRYLVGAKVEWPAGSGKCYRSFVITEGDEPPGLSWEAVAC